MQLIEKQKGTNVIQILRNMQQDKNARGQSNGAHDAYGNPQQFAPDYSKKQALKNRWYDKGISNNPMPSVKRPIDDNLESRPFSARMGGANRVQSLSPLKKKLQHLNQNQMKNMNMSYKEASKFEKYHDILASSAFYQGQQQMQAHSPFVGGQPMNRSFQVGSKPQGSLMMSNVRVTPGMVRPREVPPLDESVKERLNQSLNQSNQDAQRFMNMPPALAYANFSGAPSQTQSNLEQARTRVLLDRITGKIPEQFRNMHQKQGFDASSRGNKSRGSQFSSYSRAKLEDSESQRGDGKLQDEKKKAKWSDLDKYIELLLDTKSEDETVFVYLNPNPNGDPYDLLVSSYQDRNEKRYYTLSGKGLTLYENDTPREYLSLGQWLIERDSYNHIKELSFFKKFKRWKFLRMWKKTIKRQNRVKAQKKLEDKLFILQDNFSQHLMKHRMYMIEMSKFRFIDPCKNSDTQKIDFFAAEQQKKRDATRKEITRFSEKCRDNFRDCISKVLSELRERIVSEIALDEERKKNHPMNSNTVSIKKKAEKDNVFERLGFPEGMTYGHRSSLRKECSRFLRFAFIIDFISLESLTKIYVGSVQDLIDRLQTLNGYCDMKKVMEEEFDEATRAHQTQIRGRDPLFHVDVFLQDQDPLPEEEVVEVRVEEFRTPPHGNSKVEEFDLLCQIDIEKEKEEGDEEEEEADEQEEEIIEEPRYLKTAPQIQKFWLQNTPGKLEYQHAITECFTSGMECIRVFERWGKHKDLNPYADALEEWDDKVGDSWDDQPNEMLDPKECIQEDPLYDNKDGIIKDILDSAFDKADTFMTKFQPILEIYWRCKQYDIEVLMHPRLRNPTDVLSHTIKLFQYHDNLFETRIPSAMELGLLKIEAKETRSALKPFPKAMIQQIEDLVPKIIRERVDEQKRWLKENIGNLERPVGNVEDFVEQTNNLNAANDIFQEKRDAVDLYGMYYNIFHEENIKVKKEDKDNFTEVGTLVQNLQTLITNVEGQQESNQETFKKQLSDLIPKLNVEIEVLHEASLNEAFLSGQSNMFDMSRQLDELETKLNELEGLSSKYNNWQEVLSMNPTSFENLDKAREDITLRCLLWRSLQQWEDKTDTWTKTQFSQIQAKDIAAQAEQFSKICLRLEKNLDPNPIQVKLKEMVNTFKGAMPIVVALRNENLKDHHWKQIKDLIQADFDIQDPDFTLQSLIDLNAVQFQEEISGIATQAQNEASLKAQIQQLDDTWRNIEFLTKPHRGGDVPILDEIEDIYTALDESIASVNMILGSRYVKPLREEAEMWKKNLVTLNSIVDEWVNCQKQWIYLENIFAAPDIRRQLPAESQRFEQVDRFFKSLMNKTQKNPNCLRIVKTMPNLPDQLKAQNEALDEIQKKLEDYLERKRGIFPRFYFLSNDELLEILANSQRLDVIQMHLKTCFDNIVRIDIKDDIDILAMISAEKERVPFSKQPKVKGQIEQWLLGLEASMRDQLQKLMKQGMTDYGNQDRKTFVLEHYGQIVATICQIQWCQNSEAYINDMINNPFSLQDWHEINEAQISTLIDLVAGELSSLQRKIIVALVTTDVHARDIIHELQTEQVSSTYDFGWQKQLRYYWEEVNGQEDCLVRQVNAQLKYGYEYMGATSRLVITPLTDRCWITITGALHIKLGANPAGPAGTGKTESTKDLAKAIAILCIVFNCSDQVDYQMMGRLFSGLCQQGAWTCLDEFNRIDIEVLSVIAQQLLTVREALLAEKEHFLFEGLEIPLQQGFGVHITMNPGYAGRTELPDNLKVLFRPVAMMIPDYGLIAEIMLGAEGFKNAKVLSKKMVQLYKLSSEQLSKQDHYDFGMRAVKSVLVMAGSLKRANPQMHEDAVLIRAMRDSNVPKFLKEDLPLFMAIIQDLFPGIEIENPDYGELLEQIEESIDDMRLQKNQAFILKVIQLFETFNVRFGVMLVGHTTSGKTTCYHILEHVMNSLRKKNSKDERFQIVRKYVLNPKAITMGELYGEVNPISQEWKDGLASKIMRSCALEQGEERDWVVFDGPVDALWIENMNTVLDDNMTLCLANGQRIKLRPQMRILFEVQDLAVASPATVSRCGMVYLQPSDLGWRPYVRSWVFNHFDDEEILTNELKEYLYDIFEACIDSGLTKIREQLHELVTTVDQQLVVSVCNFLECFLTPTMGFKGTDEEKKKQLNQYFAFSLAWGMGASLDDYSKDRFEDVVREHFKAAGIPSQNSVYDYFFEGKKEKSFKLWSSKVEPFQYVKDVPYFQLFVETANTYRTSYCLELLLMRQKPVFITGQTGVGKSVVIQKTLTSMQQSKDVVPIYINFSAQTSSLRTQQSIVEKLEKTRVMYGAPPGKKVVVFVDDINMPATEVYGAQPPIELLRLLIDKKGMYEREEWSWKMVKDTTLMCAAAPPGGGRQPTTPRMTRHCNTICMANASSETLIKIFGSIVTGFLKAGFNDQVQKFDDVIVNNTIEIYNKISSELRATPAKFHYLFNLRDVSKVIQGILMTKPVSIQTPETACKLWVNECMRVFHDRLINDEDREWFIENIMDSVRGAWRVPVEKDEMFGSSKVMFGDLLKLEAPVKLYEEIKDPNKLKKVLVDMLDDYNIGNSNKMNLVFFEDAILHILRICRVLRQPRGNIMLIGVGGSGKQSLTKLSSHMLEMTYKQIEITKNFGPDQFKEFMKELMFSAGIDGEKVCFTMTDNQIINEGFLEDINNLLNTGEIPNLMAPEDKDKIINSVRPILVQMKRVDTIENINATFVERIRDNLHITLCMSPVGDTLRVRCRMFPSLVNCCTLNWFSRWPEQALLYVSSEFLKQVDLPSDKVRDELATMCMKIHISVEEASEKFFAQLRRRVYTTPKSYLDLISLYTSVLEQKRAEYEVNKSRLATGLKKLNDTNASIAELKIKLAEMQPQLLKKNEEIKIALEKVNADKKVANEKEKVVSAEAEIVNKKAVEAQAIADDAQSEIAKAQPELDAAQAAVKSLDKNAIVEIKTFPNPPALVVQVMEAVMLLFGEKKDWNNVRSVLGDPTGFMKKVLDYDVQKTSEAVLNKLRNQYLKNPEFNPQDVGSKSQAAKALCIWCISTDKFSKVLKKVEPKRKKYAEVKAILDQAMAELNEKTTQLNIVKDAVAKLEADCKAMQEEKARLEAEMNKCNGRMGRAEKLVVLLADEGVRWKETVGTLQEEIERLVGNIFLSSACISYFGAFTGEFREDLVKNWVNQCIDREIPTSDDFNLVKVMGDPVQIRSWGIAQLPTDQVSIENGILATKAERWPLCIDPQQQANRWLKNMAEGSDLMILKFGRNNFLRDLTGAVRNGNTVLVEDVEEYIDPAIDPILLHQEFVTDGGIKQIRLGDSTIDYDPQFKFFMTTKMPNPHYLPEVCIKVTLINFTVTFQGLEDQMLGDVVIQEKPEIEQKRDKLVVSMANDQKTLKEIEIKILKLLSESTEEQILDEDFLINVLESSKQTSKEINERMDQSVVIQEEINETRNMYTSVAVRGSILYFVIADLAKIDPMYQYSLSYVKRMFNTAIEKSEKKESYEERIALLIKNITEMMYTNVSRGLFEAHKTIYSFLITCNIRRNSGEIKTIWWNTLIRGALPVSAEEKRDQPDNPNPKLISEMGWELIYYITVGISEVYEKLAFDVVENLEAWNRWLQTDEPQSEPLPSPWAEKLDRFQTLLILKAFRPEKMLFAMTNYVESEQGRFFIESPSTSLDVIYGDIDVKTPLIFVLSQGADPTAALVRFTKERDMMEKFNVISLGQGQGPKAEELIQMAKKEGEWVVLQNCHLAKSWMPRLEIIVNNFGEEENTIHEDFRLFLTSFPAPYFPVSVLQNGVKLTTEPPRGIRANLKRTFKEMTDDTFNYDKKPEIWQKLLFGLCFFHSVIQERRKFGPLGWNIRYEFNDSDLDTSMTMLKIFLEDQDEIPWDALLYVTGHINYGGRVTDDWDRVCLITTLRKYYSEPVLDDDYTFSESGLYYAPAFTSFDKIKEYIDKMPMQDNPEIFGLHQNANITYQQQESDKIINTILLIQPRENSASGGKTPDEVVIEKANELKAQLPEILDRFKGKKELFKENKQGLMQSLSTVLIQEMSRFNKLLVKMERSLEDLVKAIQGFIVMSEELDSMYMAIQNNMVPGNWKTVSYLSLKPLASWYKDLKDRVDFMRDWLESGHPNLFTISYFFFPQGFMTGTLQTHARNYQIAIDQLQFSFQVLIEETKEDIEEPPEDGVYINGLFLIGAKWDRDQHSVVDPEPGQMSCIMPIIWFKPVTGYKPDPEEYSCPIYKTSERAGVLSTTGQSTNYILACELPTIAKPNQWTLRGAAMICMLDD